MTLDRTRTSEFITHGRHCRCSACAREDWTDPRLAPCGMHGSSCPRAYAPLGVAGDLLKPVSDAPNLLAGLPSLSRMSRRDQRLLDLRLRMLATTAKGKGATTVAANLLRASYELDTAERE